MALGPVHGERCHLIPLRTSPPLLPLPRKIKSMADIHQSLDFSVRFFVQTPGRIEERFVDYRK